MFEPETEDMLPRMAPKPSPDVPSGAIDGIIRPEVPEVSILFGQQEADLQQQTVNAASQPEKNFPQQTYAAWKKQMLPKVTYPASANMADMQKQENNMPYDYNNHRTNLYPITSNTTPPLNIVNTNLNGFVGSIGGCVTTNPPYRRGLDSCNNNVYQQIQHYPALPLQSPLSQMSNSRDVLTICAGTQTDAILDPTNSLPHLQSEFFSDLASRKDVENIRRVLDELKLEQQRVFKMLEAILFSQHSHMEVKAKCQDIGVQVNCVESDYPYINGVDGANQQPVPINKFLEHLKPTNNILQTPKGKPIAQSTAYQSNSPQFQLVQRDLPEMPTTLTNQEVSNKSTPTMHKSASDTSLAMNDLALKYLPNEKLAELLKELDMNYPLAAAVTSIPTTPVRGNTDKFEKGPSDISNASYKYLKKYRLLPEDHEENGNKNVENAGHGVIESGNDNEIPQYNSPQYNNIRNTPKNQRQTPTNKCSPFTGRLPLSPLARASPTLSQPAVPQHIVNLENIKHQPKFL